MPRNLQRFVLRPFPGDDDVPDITIAGTVARRASRFLADFTVRGTLSELSVPAPGAPAARMDRLWEGTCLELFVGPRGSRQYWEFNLSPAGHWNVYRFASYRKGMREEESFASLPFRVRREPDALRLSLEMDVGRIVPADRDGEVSPCAVIRTRKGGISHWALAHSGPRPDFHRREGFRLLLPGGGAS